ncbi:GTPase [Thalassiella azotivora]
MVEPDVASRVEALERALVAGGDRLPADAAEQASAVLRRTDERFRLGADHTVVAFAGSTGSGKSSLFNALAGLEVARVGARRPTTSSPTACVWGPGADALLEWLDVPRRHRTSRETVLDGQHETDLHGLVLLDLPDHDSTELSHRLEVDRLVGLVDLLVWVVDPQKYADEALHHRYLRRLVGHEAVMLVVLNQVDRLPPEAVAPLRADLGRLLEADGLEGVRVLTTSAVTRHGVEDLRGFVGAVVRERQAVVQRADADLRAVATRLRDGVADREPDPERLAATDLLVDALAGAAGVPAVLDAVEGDYRRSATAATGWPFTRWLRRLRPDPLRRLRLDEVGEEARRLQRSSLPAPTQAQRAQVELATRRVAQAASQGLPQPWVDAVHEAATPPGEDVADALDQAVVGVDLERRRPVWWRVVGVLQALLAVAAVTGLLWLVTLAVLAWLRLPEPGTPEVGVVPLPTLLLLGGLLGGLLLAAAARPLVRLGARRRRRRTERRLRAAVRGVAHRAVLQPVTSVLQDHRLTRLALDAAR